jgi:long-chain fatty acid transport protein
MRRAELILALTLLARPGAASVGDVFGFGSRSAALAGAATAVAEGLEATYYNPARLGGEPRFSAGFLGGASLLSANGARQAIEDPVGILLGASTPIPLGGVLRDRIHVGIGLYLVPDKIVREIGRQPTEPFFPLFDNRTQRLVILPAISVKLSPKISVGVAANVLAALGGTVNVREGPFHALDARVNEDLLTTFAFNAGISLRPVPRLTLGLTVREEFSLPYFVDSRTTLAGSPLTLNLRAKTLYEPATIALGAAYEVSDQVLLSADLAFKRWSRYPGGLVEVSGSLPIPVGSVPRAPIEPELPEVGFRDIVTVRAGVEWKLWARGDWQVDLRGGYGFEPSPVPAQKGATNFVDGDKHLVALGAGLLRRGSFALDAHILVQVVGATRVEKGAGAPFPVLEGGGAVVSGGLVGSYFFR